MILANRFPLLLTLSCLLISGCTTSSNLFSPVGNPNDRLLIKFQEGFAFPNPSFVLNNPGFQGPLDYSKYGEFKNVGTATYQYVIRDAVALRKDLGQGIYPNENGVYSDPAFKEMKKDGLLKDSHWDVIPVGILQ